MELWFEASRQSVELLLHEQVLASLVILDEAVILVQKRVVLGRPYSIGFDRFSSCFLKIDKHFLCINLTPPHLDVLLNGLNNRNCFGRIIIICVLGLSQTFLVQFLAIKVVELRTIVINWIVRVQNIIGVLRWLDGVRILEGFVSIFTNLFLQI